MQTSGRASGKAKLLKNDPTVVLPGRKSDFRAGFWPDCHREINEIGPPAGHRPAGGPMSVLSRWQSQLYVVALWFG